MGSFCSHISCEIDDELLREQEIAKKVIRVLLLGSGESGKSTIFKQMKILHLQGFSVEERSVYVSLIQSNAIESMQALASFCLTMEIKFANCDNEAKALNLLKSTGLGEKMHNAEQLKNDLKSLWQDEATSVFAYKRQNEFHLLDSAKYFLDALDRIFEPNYVPSDKDILRSRVATTGIVETSFWLDDLQFKMFDVGGQRGERKKWIHCFDGATAILFIASLSEYDQVLAEDRTRNRLVESLDIFEGMLALPWFKTTPIILFLNKQDIFAKKILDVDIGIYFSNYTGSEHNYEEGLLFIQDSYLERNSNENKNVYCHVTDATNTENIEFVWKASKHIILEQNLLKSGLMMI